ncbi:uncharacterized protein LOC135366462 [Ornithodoros turicata]|uniref:uncharacterized protein LOC135366462 n=1 Tax=Ornithodoros turicata TaxID=34597 RepID=UPI00313A2FCB
MDGRKQCSVYLFHRVLDSSSLGSLTSISSSVKQFQHWIVYFIFADGTALECDGQQDATSKKLRGSARLISHSDVEPLRKDMTLLKDGVSLSKEDIREVVDDMNLNSKKYDVLWNNCQYWIKKLLGRLGVPVPDVDLREVAIAGAIPVPLRPDPFFMTLDEMPS